MKNTTVLKCLGCGTNFVRKKSAQKYCSAKCRKKQYTKPHVIEKYKQPKMFECAWCGIFFETDHKEDYCSEECRIKAGNRKNRRRKSQKTIKLEQVAKLAREAGLSYGQYVAKMGL